MITTFINKLLSKGGTRAKSPFGRRVEIPAAKHGIDVALVDKSAFNVVHTLQEAGYAAYIVGGAVRDLLLGFKPKDFDVATDATPEEVKKLFRRAFIIGKRFRIVHVVHGRGREHEVIEVSTFRAYMDNSSAEAVHKTGKAALAGMQHAVDASGRVLRDNVWGPQDEDAARRDFTVNAMYYDPITQMVVDFHKGLQDAHKRILRMIGDPAVRYREDPVRIIRAVRFAAKLHALDFQLEAKTAKPLATCLPLLQQVPPSRLLDEMLKLLQTGHACASIEQLRALGLARGIYPLLDVIVERADQPLVQAVLQDTDRRVAEGKAVAPSFLLACVLWPDVQTGWQQRISAKQHSYPALQEAIDAVFHQRIGDVSGRGKLAADMREIWVMQPRFEKRTGATPFGMVVHIRFRAGFDFLRLRADIGEVDEELVEWWQEFSLTDDAHRHDLIAQVREEQRQQQRKQQRKTKLAAPPPAMDGAAQVDTGEAPPAKKRRRRRHKPSSGGSNGDAQDV